MKDEAQTRTLSGLGSSIAIRAAVLLARVTPPHVDPLQLNKRRKTVVQDFDQSDPGVFDSYMYWMPCRITVRRQGVYILQSLVSSAYC